jgi:anti-sigma B factor antagonist
MKSEIQIIGGYQLISFFEEINIYNAGEIKAYLAALFDEHKKSLILDLRQVNFIDSSGLGALLVLHKKLQNEKGALILANVNLEIMSIFRMTMLEQVFRIIHFHKISEIPALLAQ